MSEPIHNYTQGAWQGENYDSSLNIKEIAKRLRKHIKDNHPDYKFSVRIERFSGGQAMNIYLMKAPYKVVTGRYFSDYANGGDIVYKEIDEQYCQLNHHCLEDYANSDIKNNGYVLDERVIPVLKSVVSFASGYNYDDSDSMIDYFNTNFYMHLGIGQWDKPCEYPEEVEEEIIDEVVTEKDEKPALTRIRMSGLGLYHHNVNESCSVCKLKIIVSGEPMTPIYYTDAEGTAFCPKCADYDSSYVPDYCI